METVDRSRRRLLGTLAGAAAAALFLGKWLSPRKNARPPAVLLEVPKAEVPETGALVYREARVAVVREGGKFHALSLACTHLGCTLAVAPDGLACPCHGSRFDREGRVVTGPAERPLRRHPVESRGEMLVVLA
jgi:Rieske Fe-S protein